MVAEGKDHLRPPLTISEELHGFLGIIIFNRQNSVYVFTEITYF